MTQNTRIAGRRTAAAFLSSLLFIGAVSQAAQAGTLSAVAPPSQNFNLANWKLTLPSGSEISTSVLNSGYQHSEAFFTDPRNGGMVFRCPNLAGTTANSTYSRSELREMLCPSCSASADANNFTPEDGGIMVARMRVDHVSTTGSSDKVGRVVIGQIHAPDSEVIRLYYTKRPGEAKGRIYAGMDNVDNENSYSPDIVPNTGGRGIALGEKFLYRIKLVGTRLSVLIRTRDGTEYRYVKDVDPRYRGLNMYFKAGVYNQNNTGDSSDYVQATFFKLTHSHPNRD